MTTLGRDSSPRQDAGRGVRQGSATGSGVTGAGYRAPRRGATWRGVIFLLVFALVVTGGLLYVLTPSLRDMARSMAESNPHALVAAVRGGRGSPATG